MSLTCVMVLMQMIILSFTDLLTKIKCHLIVFILKLCLSWFFLNLNFKFFVSIALLAGNFGNCSSFFCQNMPSHSWLAIYVQILNFFPFRVRVKKLNHRRSSLLIDNPCCPAPPKKTNFRETLICDSIKWNAMDDINYLIIKLSEWHNSSMLPVAEV